MQKIKILKMKKIIKFQNWKKKSKETGKFLEEIEMEMF